MAAIISEAEVTAAIEEALAEDFDDMEESSTEETATEPKIERLKYSFEPKNKYVKEVEDMNEYVLSYFESLNHMSKRIITEQREVMAECGSKWDQLSPEEQDKLIDDRMLDPKVKKHYYVDETFSTRKPDWFPVLRLAHGISGSENSFNPRDSIASVTVRFNFSLCLYTQFLFSQVKVIKRLSKISKKKRYFPLSFLVFIVDGKMKFAWKFHCL